jgi:hypothetical protein
VSAGEPDRYLTVEGPDMLYILLWLLGVPLTLIVLLFLLGIGR